LPETAGFANFAKRWVEGGVLARSHVRIRGMNDLAAWVVEQNLITDEQLGRARELQRQTGVPLAMALIELNLLEEKAIVDLLAAKHGLPQAPRRLHKVTVPPKALSLIPQDYCWQYNVFPFGIDTAARRLQLAIVDPSDREAIEAVRKLVRLELSLFVAGPRQVEKGIRRHYLDSWVDETNAPAKRLRYFGYDNITSPGVEQPKRPATAGGLPVAPAEALGPPALAVPSPPAVTPIAPLAPVAHAAGEAAPDLTWDAADPGSEVAATESATEDLPVLKAMPTVPNRQVGRLQPTDPQREVLQRLDRVERTLAGLLELLAGSSQANLGNLSQLLESLRSR
jgi:hypothetical protein